MDTDSTLARRARKRRLELGATQQQVAQRINSRGYVTVTRRDISRVENSELITPHFVEDLAIALEVSAVWLASGMTAREHEQLLAGTLAASGIGAVGMMGELERSNKEAVGGRVVVAVLLIAFWAAIVYGCVQL